MRLTVPELEMIRNALIEHTADVKLRVNLLYKINKCIRKGKDVDVSRKPENKTN